MFNVHKGTAARLYEHFQEFLRIYEEYVIEDDGT
jgi:hypothetical protein